MIWYIGLGMVIGFLASVLFFYIITEEEDEEKKKAK
jgi:hypothetical protein